MSARSSTSNEKEKFGSSSRRSVDSNTSRNVSFAQSYSLYEVSRQTSNDMNDVSSRFFAHRSTSDLPPSSSRHYEPLRVDLSLGEDEDKLEQDPRLEKLFENILVPRSEVAALHHVASFPADAGSSHVARPVDLFGHLSHPATVTRFERDRSDSFTHGFSRSREPSLFSTLSPPSSFDFRLPTLATFLRSSFGSLSGPGFPSSFDRRGNLPTRMRNPFQRHVIPENNMEALLVAQRTRKENMAEALKRCREERDNLEKDVDFYTRQIDIQRKMSADSDPSILQLRTLQQETRKLQATYETLNKEVMMLRGQTTVKAPDSPEPVSVEKFVQSAADAVDSAVEMAAALLRSDGKSGPNLGLLKTPGSAATTPVVADKDANSFDGPVKGEEAQWPCPACTFLNHAAIAYCELCGVYRPTDMRTAVVLTMQDEDASERATDGEEGSGEVDAHDAWTVVDKTTVKLID